MRAQKLLAYTANQIFAKGLQALLEPGIEVRSVSPGLGKLAIAVEEIRPDVLLMDELRADVGGVADVNRRFPEVRIVAWIISDSPELSMQLLEAGATALLQNNCGEQELAECIACVLRGEKFIPAALQSALWNARRCKITRREGELILRIAQGFTNKEIAWQLKITEGTVKVYLSRLFMKLGVGDRYELALLGLRNGTSSKRPASRVPVECIAGLRTPVPPAVYLTSN